ncbi:MAG: hypothetical protein OHK93_005409 [Ramalina farinacea]|uniref:Peptidase A1 domain-containing protein n=1 Tax=Ramalina farinacea TaxID=258253 RepID=A0AA43TS19_9LECA|nr:hypothetical protein [Ramalina farinacea]
MTVQVDPGIEIRIPNHQLIMPVYGADASGHLYINDTEDKKIRLWTDTNPPVPPEEETIALGRSFMSSMYLLVDYDRGNFTIWPSTATNETDLVPIGPSSCDQPLPATPSEPATFSDPAVPSESASSSDSITQHTVSKRTLAGSIVGGCSGLAILIAIPYCLVRRHRRRRRQDSNIHQEAEENLNWWRRWQQAQGPFWWLSKPELPDDSRSKPPQVAGNTYHEMSSTSGSHVQHWLHEMPGDSIQPELPAAEISTELPLTRGPHIVGLGDSHS